MSMIMSSPPRPLFTPYTPTKPSPLSFSSPIGMGIDENLPPAPSFGSSPIQPRQPPSQFRRPFQPNPLMRSSEDTRERRRNQFLQKIRDQREQKTMDMRGGMDEMQRTMFLAEKRRREEYQRREALLIDLSTSYEDEMIDDGLQMEQMHPDEAALIDEMIAQEEEELNSLLSNYNPEENYMAENSQASNVPQPQPTQNTACPSCASDELFDMNGETICFNCGWSFRR